MKSWILLDGLFGQNKDHWASSKVAKLDAGLLDTVTLLTALENVMRSRGTSFISFNHALKTHQCVEI